MGKSSSFAQEYRRLYRTEWCRAGFYRDMCAEFVGTFMLMAVQSALPLSWGPAGLGGVVQVSLSMGFLVSTMAWSLGEFGGALFNPAVTLAMMLLAKITVVKGLLFIGVQCAACLGGAAFINVVTPYQFTESLAATTLHPDVQPWQGVLIEAWITFMLVLTILGSTNDVRKRPLYMPPLLIGMAVTMGIMCAFASTGASMNPARSLGPAAILDLMNGDPSLWKYQWVYWAGPMLGSVLAVIIYGAFFDKVEPPRSEDGVDLRELLTEIRQILVAKNIGLHDMKADGKIEKNGLVIETENRL